MKQKSGFKVYFPDDGHGPEDAVDIYRWEWQKYFSLDDAAQAACEYDYDERDGWERGMAGGSTEEFAIIIIAPDGAEHRYGGWHEASVEHNTRRDHGDKDRDGIQAGEGAGRPDAAGAGQEGADGQAGRVHPAESGAQGQDKNQI